MKIENQTTTYKENIEESSSSENDDESENEKFNFIKKSKQNTTHKIIPNVMEDNDEEDEWEKCVLDCDIEEENFLNDINEDNDSKYNKHNCILCTFEDVIETTINNVKVKKIDKYPFISTTQLETIQKKINDGISCGDLLKGYKFINIKDVKQQVFIMKNI